MCIGAALSSTSAESDIRSKWVRPRVEAFLGWLAGDRQVAD
jgi:hypothetical protein